MSTVDADVEAPGAPTAHGAGEVTPARIARVGDIDVRRLLPMRRRRSVGAWCFVDHYGPASVDGVAGMRVPPHPHIGLQTVTWLLEGDVRHTDSLGSEQVIRPGQLNLMTAGHGIAHAEVSPQDRDPRLHGVQLWLALPDAARHGAPAFEHHADLPSLRLGDFEATVFAGAMAGPLAAERSPARVFSPVVGAEVAAPRDARAVVPLEPSHEHVVFVARGTAQAQAPGEKPGTVLAPGRLLYLGTGRESVTLSAPAGARLFLLGGEPLGETLLMWWNFVGRTPDDIAAAVRDWRGGARFGAVAGYDGEPLPAPPLDPSRLARRA